jgi:hypothetical protein
MHRRRGEAGDRNCDQPVVLLPTDGEMVAIIGLSRQERDALVAAEGRPIRDVLEELGVLIRRVA